MIVNVGKVTSGALVNRACSFTSGKPVEITDRSAMYRAEHSPIRTQMFVVEMFSIPSYVSVHFTRHKIGVEHFVKSNRRADEVVTRDTPVNHMMFINAQALINMARFRLCHKADAKTQEAMRLICDAVRAEDSSLADAMVPNCVYRGKCPEMKPC